MAKADSLLRRQHTKEQKSAKNDRTQVKIRLGKKRPMTIPDRKNITDPEILDADQYGENDKRHQEYAECDACSNDDSQPFPSRIEAKRDKKEKSRWRWCFLKKHRFYLHLLKVH